MKPVAVAVIVTAGAILTYVMLTGGDCAGATVYRDVASCVSSSRTVSGCQSMMAAANRRLTQTGPVFDMRQQCEDHYRSCQPAVGAVGFVPVATGFCLKPGAPDRVVPVFGRG